MESQPTYHHSTEQWPELEGYSVPEDSDEDLTWDVSDSDDDYYFQDDTPDIDVSLMPWERADDEFY